MDYSTFNSKTFFIKKGSTYPYLKYPLTQYIMEKYDITEDMMDYAVATFSMNKIENGKFYIANKPADIIISEDRTEFPDETKYSLVYKFLINDTQNIGNYLGEFKLDILGQYGYTLTLPVNEKINITILDSITKTTVV